MLLLVICILSLPFPRQEFYYYKNNGIEYQRSKFISEVAFSSGPKKGREEKAITVLISTLFIGIPH